ncbi:MAG: electron transport complex subunit RsxC, partial [Phycisphaerae bacterium]|nr:electron transport complex subunit RsxC [Phycisphaerae bacterium]
MTIAETTKIPGKRSFARGVHPDAAKSLSAGAPVEVLPTPGSVLIPLSQHIGAPCRASVKPRTEVSLGDVVGDVEAFVSAP